MSELTYQELVAELFPRLTGGIRWGLERTQELLASVGNPQDSYRSVHIAGTNGKGSVAATLGAILARTGGTVGLYSSPHLCTLRERFQVQQNALSEEVIVGAARRLWPAVQRLQPSFFEATTAIGLLAFAEVGIDLAVVEVGLGGRLDATNVIQPELTIITNIAFDHRDYLGDTLEAIAIEKAGIIKNGIPLLTAEQGFEALNVFRARAAQAYAPVHVLAPANVRDVAFDLRGTSLTTHWRARPQTLRTPLIGRHQAVNTALAVRAAELLSVDLDASHIQRGLAQIKWPGRMQIESVDAQCWVFDVAHNVAGVQALVECLALLPLPRPIVLVVGILGDKDWRAMLPPLFEAVDEVVLTVPPTAPAGRTWDPDQALVYAGDRPVRVNRDFVAALEVAHARAGQGTVLVTGSFHTVGDALICLQRTPFGSDVTLPRVSFAG
ncbi:MAG TPA: folylpolyglutamate synthase/dihydrofolate synthase family protein [Longimicrobiales bacterium]|nr:folylpolyglutamate synthase/dihydrofolate synthase family protein [Longimicrobiales bacterium]